MLKTFDYQCTNCGHAEIDVIMEADVTTYCCPECNGIMERTWGLMSRGSAVVGDECDVEIRHGLCNADGSPRRFTSKSDIEKEAKKRGLVNHVEHKGTKGGDRSKHTLRWI